jgi:type I site-specific restriction-modification system R (restriction) subunit
LSLIVAAMTGDRRDTPLPGSATRDGPVSFGGTGWLLGDSHDHAIRLKAEIMVDHFHQQVIALRKIGGQARAMVVTSGIQRAHPQKHDVFVLDFMNDADTIQTAFADYYRTTILSEETDPSKLHDLKADLDGYQVYAGEQVDALVELYLGGADRDRLDPILDACVADCKELDEEDAEIEPVPTSGGGLKAEPELDLLSNILKAFNDQFGNIPWADTDRVQRLITEDIPAQVAADTAYQNAKMYSDRENARIEHDKALARVMIGVLRDDTELYKQFSDNESFRRWLMDTVFALTYQEAAWQGAGV